MRSVSSGRTEPPLTHLGWFLIFVALALGGCWRDLSGLTADGQGRILVVNNRPGAFLLCAPDGDSLDCKRLAFRTTRWERYDLEGVAFVRDDLFYAVSEKRDNQCLGGCSLMQDLLAFRIAEDGCVVPAACGSLTIPLFEGDDPECGFANCGLEGVAYVPERNLLYVAKEYSQARLFAVQLDGRQCPTGVYAEARPPEPLSSYNDLAWSPRWESLFLLSANDSRFVAWNLQTNAVVLRSEDVPEAAAFMKAHRSTEGIWIDDAQNRVLLLEEGGAFGAFELPPLPVASAAVKTER